MSVLSYLQARSSGSVLSSVEIGNIERSISTLSIRLDNYFGNDISHFKFGSSTRDTILPRRMDERSDIDYMVVFADDGCAPQTYLNRLKRFITERYQTSEVYQSSPTIVLEMNHIKFELVPALGKRSGVFRIPNGSLAWQDTAPNEFNSTLTQKNVSERHLIKPAIRLIKYWNAVNEYVYASYSLEQWIVKQSYSTCYNLKDYVLTIFEKLKTQSDTAQWRVDRVARAKKLSEQVKYYESYGMADLAEAEVKKIIPE